MIAISLILATALLAFVNGANDVSKGIATLVGSGVTNYRRAIAWGALCTVSGAFAAGFVSQTLVSTFSGKGLLVRPETSTTFLLAVALGAIGWLIVATLTGLPVSTTHALVGALVGAALVESTANGIAWAAVANKVAVPLLLSPVLSLVLVLVVMPMARPLLSKADRYCVCVENRSVELAGAGGVSFREAVLPAPQVAREEQCGASVARFDLVDALHWVSSGTTGFFRGMNDAPKMIAIGIVAGAASGIAAPGMYLLVAIAMGAGSLLAGARVTRTMAEKVTSIQPNDGFAANAVTAVLVGLASRFSLPVSATHVSTGAIVGVGVHRGGGVRWKTVGEMGLAWIVTLPAAGLLAVLAQFAIRALHGVG